MERTLFSQVGEIRGERTENWFTTSFQFSPGEEDLKEVRGSLFLLVRVKGSEEDKALTAARGLFASFKERFYSSAGSNLKVLEEALDLVTGVSKQQGLEIEVATANLWGSVLYVGKIGEAGIILVRDRTAKKINVAKVASGALQDRDNIIIADPAFLKNNNPEALAASISKEDFEDSLKATQEAVKGKEGSALCVRLSVQEPIETPEPVLIADLDKRAHPKKETKLRRGRWLFLSFLGNLPADLKFLRGRGEVAKKYWATIKRLLRELLRKASFVILAPWLPHTPGSLEDPAIRKRKRISQIVAILAAVLLISIIVGVVNLRARVNREKFETAISSIESKLEDAENLQTINPSQTALFLQEAEEKLADLSSENAQVQSLKAKLEKLLAQINKMYPAKLKEFVDLTALKGGIDTTTIKRSAEAILVLDKGTGSVYKVTIADKQPTILVSEKKDLQNIALAGGFVYAQTKTGIDKVDIQIGSETNAAGSSSVWKKLIAAATYRDNLYLLDSGAKQIWKYVPAGGGLGDPTGYLVAEFKKEPVSFAVDGAVWVASKTEIFKFFGGKKADFTVKKAPQKFGSIQDIYTDEGLANLYVLDKSKGGIFVINKESGDYQGFYKERNLGAAISLVVDEAKKAVFVLRGDAIFTFKLR